LSWLMTENPSSVQPKGQKNVLGCSDLADMVGGTGMPLDGLEQPGPWAHPPTACPKN